MVLCLASTRPNVFTFTALMRAAGQARDVEAPAPNPRTKFGTG